MRTISSASILSIEEQTFLPLFTRDVSTQANRWFIYASGLDVETWSVELPSTHTPCPTAVKGLVVPSDAFAEPYVQKPPVYSARTALGKRLWEIRAKIVASGEPLLSWEEIEQELVERRGEMGRIADGKVGVH